MEGVINYILTFLSIICTIVSIIGARKSLKYYMRNKQLNFHTKTNSASIECSKMIANLTDLLDACHAHTKRGVNKDIEIKNIGKKIKTSIIKIEEVLPHDDSHYVHCLLNSEEPNVNSYVDSIIAGKILLDDLSANSDFEKCQEKFYKLQQYIKKRLDEIENQLK